MVCMLFQHESLSSLLFLKVLKMIFITCKICTLVQIYVRCTFSFLDLVACCVVDQNGVSYFVAM